MVTANSDTPPTPSAMALAAAPTASAAAPAPLATPSSPSKICRLSRLTLSFSVYASSRVSAAAVPVLGPGLEPELELEREYHEKLREWRAKGGSSRGGNGSVGMGRWRWWWLGLWVAADRWATAAASGGGRSRRRPTRRIASAMAMAFVTVPWMRKVKSRSKPSTVQYTNRSLVTDGSDRLKQVIWRKSLSVLSQIAVRGRSFNLHPDSSPSGPSLPSPSRRTLATLISYHLEPAAARVLGSAAADPAVKAARWCRCPAAGGTRGLRR